MCQPLSIACLTSTAGLEMSIGGYGYGQVYLYGRGQAQNFSIANLHLVVFVWQLFELRQFRCSFRTAI